MWSDFPSLATGWEGESRASSEVSMLSSVDSWKISPSFLNLVTKLFLWFQARL